MGKRLEFLREVMPGLNQIAIIANPDHSGEPLELKVAQRAAAQLGLSYRYFPVRSEGELEQALVDVARGRDEAILVFSDGFTLSFARRLASWSVAQKIPAVSGWALFAQRGNLMSYGPSSTNAIVGWRHTSTRSTRARNLPICRSSGRRRSSS